MRIRTKTLLIAFLPIIILVLVTIAVVYQLFEKTSTAVVLKRDSELARITAERISEGLSRYCNHLQEAALDSPVLPFLLYGGRAPRLSDAYLRNSFDGGFAIFDEKGTIRWSDITVSSRLLQLFKSTASFKKIQKTLRPVFSDILRDPENGFQVFIVAVPVIDRKGTYIGALCGIAQLEYSFIEVEFARMLEIQSGYSGYAYLVDGRGRLIYHRRHRLIGSDFTKFEPVRLVIKGKTGAIITRDLEGNMVIGGFAPVPGTSWNVVTHERWDIILRQVFRIVLIAGLFILGGIFVISIFLFFGIGRALNPIRELIRGTEQVASGNFDFRVNVTSKDEFNVLSRRFNSMAAELHNSYVQLQDNLKTIAEKERIMTALMGNLPGMVFRGRSRIKEPMIFVSDGCLSITGYTAEELTGDDAILYRNLVVTEDRDYLDKTLDEQLGNYNNFEVVHRLKTKKGEVKWVYIKGSRYVSTEGDEVIEGFISDITELRMKDEQLKQAQKMEIIGNLAGGIAHDFNNVLVGIMGPLSILKRMMKEKGRLDAVEMKGYLEMIGESGVRASNLVKQLLSLGRRHDLNIEAVNINTSVEKIVNVCRSTFDKSIDVSFFLPDDPAIVMADETQIEQCLLNLCVNASHAMTIMREDEAPRGGDLAIDVDDFYPDSKFIDRHPEMEKRNYTRISIHDTGVGMDHDTLEKIFDPFFTTKSRENGSGLGLSMVYNIIREHHGLITVYSEPGIGTTFNVFLPREENAEMHDKTIDSDRIIEGSGLILVVDDEEAMRLIAREFLETAGYRVMVAPDGPEALEIFSEKYIDIDLVIMDMAMPKMYGDELFRKLKEIDPHVKVLLASGFSRDRRSVKILAEGVRGFLQKPFTAMGLTGKVKKILEGE